MDFTIKKPELIAAIDKCSVAAPGDHQNAAFNVMRVEAKKKVVRFAAVGERATVDTVSPGTVKEMGYFNVRPKHLQAVVSAMPDGEIRFTLKGTRVTAKSMAGNRKATFESHATDIFSIDDPGQGAPWVEIDARELTRVLKIVKPFSVWEDRNDPEICLLVPTPRGVDVFACNGHQLAIVESSIRIEGAEPAPIKLPSQAVDVLFQMVNIDDKVRIFSDERRVYLENGDTLVSAALPALYPFENNHQNFTDLLKGIGPENHRDPGPVFDPGLLLSGVKSVMSLGGFASQDERKKGISVRVRFGQDTVRTELALGDADGADEFPVVTGDGELESLVDSVYLTKVLNALGSTPNVKVYHGGNDVMLILQAQGIACGCVKKMDQAAINAALGK